MHNFLDGVSECEDSAFEFDDLYTPELNKDSSFSGKSEQDFSWSFNYSPRLIDRLPKRPRIQTRLETTKAPQEIDDTGAEINVSSNEMENNQNIELATDTSQSNLPSSAVDDAAKNTDSSRRNRVASDNSR